VAARIAAKLVKDVDVNIEKICCLSQNFQDYFHYFVGAIPCGCPKFAFIAYNFQPKTLEVTL